MNELNARYRLFAMALPSVKKQLQSIDNCLAVGIGFKEIAGILQERLVYRVYVKKKKDKASLPPDQLISSLFFNLETDIVEAHILNDYFQESVFTNPVFAERRKVLAITSTVRHDSFGTIGSFGQLKNGTFVFLTNKHVVYDSLAETTTRNFTVHYKTENGFIDRGVIGHTIAGIKNELVDCALVSCSRSRNDFPKNLMGNMSDSETLPGDYVVKNGVGTGFTKGFVMHKGDLACADEKGNIIIYKNKLIIYPSCVNVNISVFGKKRFSGPGDSGAVILNENNQVVGLIHAGAKHLNAEISLVSEIAEVTKAFACTYYPVVSGSWNPIPNAIIENEPYSKRLSPDGEKELSRLFLQHKKEVLSLIRKSRLIATTWSNYKGHEFAAQFNKYFEGATTSFPQKKYAIGFRLLANKMMEALATKGSHRLQEDIRNYGDWFTNELEKIIKRIN